MLRFLLVLIALALALPAAAQERRQSHCIALADAAPGARFVRKVAFGDSLAQDTVRLSYLRHAMFMLETPAGVRALTDYAGYFGSTEVVPDVATMNHAHSSHWTRSPDPRIGHVLRGWNPEGGAADHHLEVGDMLVRNVPTDIRSGFGTGREPDGNSIFVFEVAGLCIGHLGHLHHVPTQEDYAMLGRLDVVMAPVDGGYTMELPKMIETLKTLRSSIVLPMHWFGGSSLERFLNGMADEFAIERRSSREIEVSLESLPERPTIVVLEPSLLRQ